MNGDSRARSVVVISAVVALVSIEIASLYNSYRTSSCARSQNRASSVCCDNRLNSVAFATLGVIATTLLCIWITLKVAESTKTPFDTETAIIITSFGVSSFVGLVLSCTRLAMAMDGEDDAL